MPKCTKLSRNGEGPFNFYISSQVMLPRTLGTSPFKASSRLSRLSSTLHAPFSTMSSNITLYTWPTPNGIKASITLEELGLPYKTVPIDISTNIQKEEYAHRAHQLYPRVMEWDAIALTNVINRWFLKINPNGRIPAITDGSQRVFESGAIMLYLAEKYDTDRKISYAPGTPEHVEQLSWLMFQMGGVGPMQGTAITEAGACLFFSLSYTG